MEPTRARRQQVSANGEAARLRGPCGSQPGRSQAAAARSRVCSLVAPLDRPPGLLSACDSAFVRRRESRPLHFAPSPQPGNLPSAPTRFSLTFLSPTSLHCDGPFQADRSCSSGRRFVATTSSAVCFQLDHPAALFAPDQRHYHPPCPPWITKLSRVRMTVSPPSRHCDARLPAMTRR